MKTLFIACGCFNLAFALFHIAFWLLFGWKKDLQKLHPANRRTVEQFIFLRMKHGLVTILTVVFMIGTLLHLWPAVGLGK